VLKFILEIVMVSCLGFVVYLFARAMPRIDDTHALSPDNKTKGDIISPYLEKADEWIMTVFEKFLRRAKIWVLRMDNLVNEQLNRFKRDLHNNKKQLTETIEKKEEDATKDEI